MIAFIFWQSKSVANFINPWYNNDDFKLYPPVPDPYSLFDINPKHFSDTKYKTFLLNTYAFLGGISAVIFKATINLNLDT